MRTLVLLLVVVSAMLALSLGAPRQGISLEAPSAVNKGAFTTLREPSRAELPLRSKVRRTRSDPCIRTQHNTDVGCSSGFVSNSNGNCVKTVKLPKPRPRPIRC